MKSFQGKTYSDGTKATGLAPLPSFSPKQQDVSDALKWLGDLESLLGGKNGPSIQLRNFILNLAY